MILVVVVVVVSGRSHEQKQVLSDMLGSTSKKKVSTKALTPAPPPSPTELLAVIAILCKFFYSCQLYTYVFETEKAPLLSRLIAM